MRELLARLALINKGQERVLAGKVAIGLLPAISTQ